MSTVWLSNLNKDSLIRDHSHRSWLLSHPADPRISDRVLLFIHLQEPAANVRISNVTITQKAQPTMPGLGRQGSQPGFLPAPRGVPALAKALSHTAGGSSGNEPVELEVTFAALRPLRAQIANENAWFVSIPLPFSLCEDSADLWGPDALPLVDTAKLSFAIEAESNQGTRDTHMCNMEIDSQCLPSLVGVVAVLHAKCESSAVYSSCLQSTMHCLPWLAVNVSFATATIF